MLIIRSRGAAQELRRLTSDLQRVIGWSNSGRLPIKSSRLLKGLGVARSPRRPLPRDGVDQTLLPLHLSFWRTTLKNDASGNEANGSVFFAFRTVTIDPRSTWMGLRPSSVRYTG